MNKRFLVLSLLLVAIFLVFRFCGNKPDEEKAPEQKTAPLNVTQNSGLFNESFTKLLQSYYSLKDALVNADTVKANSAANELMKSADSLSIDEIKGDTSGTIRETAKYFAGTISSSAKALPAESKSEDKLREFNMITDAMWSLTRTVKYDGQKVYYQFCPLALEGMGGYWLSDKADRGNPYLSDKAKSCSELTDSLDYSKK
jgi:Cu(I)/Ag(I) efflux system membrane fusion protein